MGRIKQYILVITDDEYTKGAFLEYLEATTYQVINANNSMNAFEKLQEQLPDLMICHNNIAKLDGCKLIKTL